MRMHGEWTQVERQALSVWGYLSFLVGAVAMAMLAPGPRVFVVLGLVVSFCALFCAGSLRLLRQRQFWLLIASALLLSPFFIGEKDVTLWGLRLSQQGFWAGLWMTARALTMGLAFNGFASRISVAELATLLEGAGLRGLGFALGVAFNVLPIIQQSAADAYTAMRLRGGFRRERFSALKKLLVTIVAGSLRRGEEIVDAAEARAFDPARPQGQMARPTHADVLLAFALLCGGLAILLPQFCHLCS